MRQVPQYLILGNGRVSKHFQYYFNILGLNYQVWTRALSLQEHLKSATHVLILTKDEAIHSLADSCHPKPTIHFSGSLISDVAVGAHPLMTFGPDLYPESIYPKIPFIVDANAAPFAELLPGLPNPYIYLDTALKPKYHALCVLSGNFTSLLWQKLLLDFEQELKIPQQFAELYLTQQMLNIFKDPKHSLTGPLIRNDQVTIQNNLNALNSDPFKGVYESFVNCYNQMNGVVK